MRACRLSFLRFSPVHKRNQRSRHAPRLPIYTALRPASASEASGPIQTGGSATSTGSLTLGGTGLCTGTVVAGTVSSNSYVNLLPPDSMDTGLWGTNVLMMATTPAELGIMLGQPFRWRVVSCPGWAAFCVLPLDLVGHFE